MCRKVWEQAICQGADIPRAEELHDHMQLVKLHAYENLQFWQDELQAYEIANDIDIRWTPESEEWQHTMEYLAIQDYQKALDKLEGLVVQRLFKLAKMGLSGTSMDSE